MNCGKSFEQIDNISIEMVGQFVERCNLPSSDLLAAEKRKSQSNTLKMVVHKKCFDTIFFHFESLFLYF